MFGSLASYLRQHHVGVLALFVALSGTAYAASLPRNSVGTAQLKRNAVTSAKVQNRSLRAADFALRQLPVGPQGAQGPKGDTGPQGAKGDTGSQGPPGVTGVVMRVVGPSAEQAFCNSGEVGVGGGGIADSGAFLTQSQPIPFSSGTAPTGWVVNAATASGTDAAATAWVVCAF